MTQREALTILRLEEKFTPEMLEKAYLRMRQRYPVEQFPQRAQEIGQAYELLRRDNNLWNELFTSNTLVFERLKPYLKVNNKEISDKFIALTDEELERKLSSYSPFG